MPISSVRGQFGGYLHTLQDFFSHTNWVNLQISVPPIPDFDTYPFNNPDENTVKPCAPYPSTDTLLYPTGVANLISGYAGPLQALALGLAPSGQCAHGLEPITVLSQLGIPTTVGNGIHKDWPGRPDHLLAASRAESATIDATLFILDKDRGNDPNTVCEFMTDKPCPTGSTLTVVKQGNGAGTVTSSPSGIQCDPTCNTSFAVDTSVTLAATPDVGSMFTGWSGDCSGTNPVFSFVMDQDKSCTAVFTLGTTPTTSNLAVAKQGTGSGTVTSSPLGIQCDPGCSMSNASFSVGTFVTLTATPDPGSLFNGWSGDCTGTNSVFSLVRDQDKSCTVTFSSGNPTLTVVKQGSGLGTVTSAPSGIQCDPTCSTNFSVGTTVTLMATPDPGSVFNGWTDDCSGSGTSLTASVDMLTDRTCTPTFSIGSMLIDFENLASGTMVSDQYRQEGVLFSGTGPSSGFILSIGDPIYGVEYFGNSGPQVMHIGNNQWC